jgi:hypothetical protein
MSDIFNKKKLRDLEVAYENAKQENLDQKRIIVDLKNQLEIIKKQVSELNQTNEFLTNETKSRARALEVFLTEFATFVLLNKSKDLVYDSLDSAKSLIDPLCGLNEFCIGIDMHFKNVSAKSFSRRFNEHLQNSKRINSHVFQSNIPIVVKSRIERYFAYVKVYSSGSVDLIIDEIYSFLYKQKVEDISLKITDDKTLIFEGKRMESNY